MTQAIELDPHEAVYHCNNGIAKSSLENYSGAVVDYTNAIELNPEYADYYNYRGIAK